MSYWNQPPVGSHRKKPLTKKQLEAIREAYKKGDMIVEQVKELEAKESKKTKKQIEQDLDSAFI